MFLCLYKNTLPCNLHSYEIKGLVVRTNVSAPGACTGHRDLPACAASPRGGAPASCLRVQGLSGSVLSASLLCGTTLVLMLHLWPLSLLLTPSDFLCRVYNLPQVRAFQSSIFCSSSSLLLFLIFFSFPLILIYSYVAVLQMEGPRPSQPVSITSKYPSLAAGRGGGRRSPVLTGAVV